MKKFTSFESFYGTHPKIDFFKNKSFEFAGSYVKVEESKFSFDFYLGSLCEPLIYEEGKSRDLRPIIFEKCEFEKSFLFNEEGGHFDTNITFYDCKFFESLDFSNATFNKKVRFKKNCVFHKDVKLENTKFKDLVDFSTSKFNKDICFERTDFEAKVVFSESIFEKSVNFKYTNFENSVFFRGTDFKAIFDLSTANIVGQLYFFKIKYNPKFDVEIEGKCFDLENNLETLRILFSYFQSKGDVINEIKYRALHRKLLVDFGSLSDFDRFTLRLNKYSNHFGEHWHYGVCFTIFGSLIIFYLMIINTENFEIGCPSSEDVFQGIVSYLKFINPTHSIDFMEKLKPNLFWYFLDTIGRIYVSYGIYQTIQAFRKFK